MKKMLFFQINTTVKIAKYIAKTASTISLEEVFYYYGYIVGMILETLAEIFFTAGSATAAKWSARIAEFTEKTLGKLATFVKSFLNKAKTILDKVLDFIDLLLSKLKKGAKYLFEEFSTIVDEIFGAGKKVEDLPATAAEERVLAKEEARAKRLEEKANRQKFKEKVHDYLAKWDKAKNLSKGGKGFLGGQRLNRSRVRFWIEEIEKISDGKAILRILENEEEINLILKGNRAGFNPFNQSLVFQKGMTEYEMLHEFKHLEEFIKIGKSEYIKGMRSVGGSLEENLIRTYKREMYVYNEVMKNAQKFNKQELKHAQWIIDEIIKDGIDSGIDLTKIKI